nr:NADH dehydrogenase subunit 6 [Ephemerella notata]
MSSFLLLSTLNISCMFLFMSHPLAMGLTLLIQTCLVAFLTGCLNVTFWFSYILFLVFLGGMLVLFIYMTSLASNEMFSLSYIMVSTLFLLIGLFLLYSLTNLLFDWINPTAIMTSLFYSSPNNIVPEGLILKLYNTMTFHLTLLLACYLFLTLIVVVNITSLSEGPLRSHGI